jgi:hypothetical protein
MFKQLFNLLVFFSLTFIGYSQDAILLMNGERVEGITWEIKDGLIYLTAPKKNLFGKEKLVSRELNQAEVFALYREGQEHIIYVQDTLLGDYYNTEEMRMYLVGSHDAKKNYKARHIMAIGYIVCGTASFIIGDGLLVLVLTPVIYGTVQLIGKIKIREKYIEDKHFKYNDLYAEGFEPPARTRKIIRGMVSGIAGTVSGLVLNLITHQ